MEHSFVFKGRNSSFGSRLASFLNGPRVAVTRRGGAVFERGNKGPRILGVPWGDCCNIGACASCNSGLCDSSSFGTVFRGAAPWREMLAAGLAHDHARRNPGARPRAKVTANSMPGRQSWKSAAPGEAAEISSGSLALGKCALARAASGCG